MSEHTVVLNGSTEAVSFGIDATMTFQVVEADILKLRNAKWQSASTGNFTIMAPFWKFEEQLPRLAMVNGSFLASGSVTQGLSCSLFILVSHHIWAVVMQPLSLTVSVAHSEQVCAYSVLNGTSCILLVSVLIHKGLVSQRG